MSFTNPGEPCLCIRPATDNAVRPAQLGPACRHHPTTIVHAHAHAHAHTHASARTHTRTHTLAAVWKTSMMAGLSERGKAQVVRDVMPALRALNVCEDSSCW